MANNVIDLMKRMGDYPKNFLSEMKISTTNKAEMISINEGNARTLLNKHSKSGYVIVSPCRGFDEFGINPDDNNAKQQLAQANKPRILDIIERIKKSGFSYTPVYGGFIENKGQENEETVYERSFIIYPYDKSGNLIPFEELQAFAVELANVYNQDSVLVKAPNSNPTYIKKDGEVDFELGNNLEFNDYAQEYFTDLHKNTQGKNGTKPTRFTYTECYINPRPCSLNESHKRWLLGERFLSYK